MHLKRADTENRIQRTEIIFADDQIYSWLSRWCTARGSSTRFSLVGPTKGKAPKSLCFNVLDNNKVLQKNL